MRKLSVSDPDRNMLVVPCNGLQVTQPSTVVLLLSFSWLVIDVQLTSYCACILKRVR
jgi:hypothetical protein